jgi:hypothetical protein
MNASPQEHGGKGLAIAGLTCGIVGLILTILGFALGAGSMLMEKMNH